MAMRRVALTSYQQSIFHGSGIFRCLLFAKSKGSSRRCKHDDSSDLPQRQKAMMVRGLPKKTPIDNVKKIICVASAKGGVGKSTAAVNLTLALASVMAEEWQRSPRLGLMDADVYGPSIPRMMNLEGEGEPEITADSLMKPLVNYGVECMSLGFLVEGRRALAWRGLMVMQAVQRLVRQVAWGSSGDGSPLDCLVIDMPPGTGDVQLSIAQTVPVDGAIVITTPQEVAVGDARRGVDMFTKMDVPVLGIVQNMSYYVCGACGARDHVFGEGGGRRLAQELGVPLLCDVPLDTGIREGSDQGQPVTITQPHSHLTLAYREAARTITHQLYDK